MHRLKAALLGSAAVLVLPAKSFAQPPTSWDGAYVGGHVGFGWLNDPASTGGTGPSTLATDPFPLVGGQIGYNWQFEQRWLAGVEAGFSLSAHSDFSVPAPGGTLTGTRGLDWSGMLRARTGYLPDPGTLFYVTGGLGYAYARNDIGPTPSSGTRFAWTLGAGVEKALDAGWSMKLEYNYLGLSDAASATGVIVGGAKNPPYYVNSPNNSVHEVTIGLNYHFWSP
jgi:outer membrane immunogenic protein